MKLKIVSDGTPKGTTVTNEDGNVVLENVTEIAVLVDKDKCTAMLTVVNPIVDIKNIEREDMT